MRVCVEAKGVLCMCVYWHLPPIYHSHVCACVCVSPHLPLLDDAGLVRRVLHDGRPLASLVDDAVLVVAVRVHQPRPQVPLETTNHSSDQQTNHNSEITQAPSAQFTNQSAYVRWFVCQQ